MPDWKEEIGQRLSGLRLEATRESEIIEEVSQHMESLYEELLADGATTEEASRLLLEDLNESEFLGRELRQIEPQITREPIVPGAGRINMIADLWQDVRYAARVFGRNPLFTFAAVLSLALGIGGNAAMFSLVNSVLIQPLPYSEPDRLVRVTNWYPKGAVAALQQQSRTMDVASFLPDSKFNLAGQGEPVHLKGASVSANLFSLLGARAEKGRIFGLGEDRPGQDRLVMLSHGLWQKKFGSDPQIIGRSIIIDDVSREVVGVMPQGFGFPSSDAELWIPLQFDPTNRGEFWEHGWMPVVARLRSGVTIEQAQSEIHPLNSQIIPLFPYPLPATWNSDAKVTPLQEIMVNDIRGKLIILMCAVGFVLLIACANVASLLLARTAARQREITIRVALGAGRERIVRQLLTESVVLSLAGGGLGVALAFKGLSIVKSVLPFDNAQLNQAGIDWRVLVFVMGLTLITGFAFGLAPAISATRQNLAESLRTRGQQSTGAARVRLRSSLIVGEVALSVLLIIGAGLLIKSLWALTQVNPGFSSDKILAVQVYPNQSAYPERAERIAFYDELLRRSRSIAGVSDVAASNTLPLSGEYSALPVEMENHPIVPSENLAPMLWAEAITPEYLTVMHIPLLRGRGFSQADGENSDKVVLVSASTAQQFWPGEDPVGKHLRPVWDQQWRTVVGVVGDVYQSDLSHKLPDGVSGAFYMPYPQSVGLDRQLPATMNLILRTTLDSPGVANEVRQLVASLNPNIPVSEVRTLEAAVSKSLSPSRALMWLFVSFAGTALILAAVGTYGVVSYTTAQRTYEMGVRVALGATRMGIFNLVMRQSLKLVIAGLALGVVASLALTQMMTSFLYGVTPTDPTTFIAVGLLLIVVALLAGYFPARRAMKVDPVIALRHE